MGATGVPARRRIRNHGLITGWRILDVLSTCMETIVIRVFSDSWFLPCQGSAPPKLCGYIVVFKPLQHGLAGMGPFAVQSRFYRGGCAWAHGRLTLTYSMRVPGRDGADLETSFSGNVPRSLGAAPSSEGPRPFQTPARRRAG